MLTVQIFIIIALTILSLIKSLDLDSKLFNTEVIGDDKVWLIEFYHPMCGSCSSFSPIWNQIEKEIHNVRTGSTYDIYL